MQQTNNDTLSVSTYIFFDVGKHRLGLSLQYVQEIIQPLPYFSVPDTHDYLKGFIRLRDEVIPLIDLPKLIQVESNSHNPEDQKYIICKIDRQTVAFDIHQIHDFVDLKLDHIQKSSSNTIGSSTIASMEYMMDDHSILLLNPDQIHRLVTELNRQVRQRQIK
ncbi:chemotaxis protein CheW [Terrilactibacillus laevilacticus]|uniref:chemotaxis protein CheW n=1 Tax=Terrilactibacillus laevilacticus TaxID=1380157 RepID=UPI001146A989|nr:chemotaxis protein CheW [Terrilactibacillus laevilacticus]